MELQGEFRKIKPITFNGENEEDAEAWLFNMTKYFQVYEYENNINAKLIIYQLQGKDALWWEEVKNVHTLEENTVS